MVVPIQAPVGSPARCLCPALDCLGSTQRGPLRPGGPWRLWMGPWAKGTLFSLLLRERAHFSNPVSVLSQNGYGVYVYILEKYYTLTKAHKINCKIKNIPGTQPGWICPCLCKSLIARLTHRHYTVLCTAASASRTQCPALRLPVCRTPGYSIRRLPRAGRSDQRFGRLCMDLQAIP